MSAPAILLIHWKAAEAAERAVLLRRAGYEVFPFVPGGPDGLRESVSQAPAAVVIDLSRLPSQGRDAAFAIRQRKAMRTVPIVFADGDPEKVERVRQVLPDAIYTRWDDIAAAVAEAIATPVAEPSVAPSVFAGYAGAPLTKKLGIGPDTVVSFLGAPASFRELIGAITEGKPGSSDLILWFVRSSAELERGIGKMAGRVSKGSMWILWPKKTSALASDLTQQIVRKTGLAAGLVDYKICSVDETWSGLRFTRRK